jgi:hypothetical protein
MQITQQGSPLIVLTQPQLPATITTIIATAPDAVLVAEAHSLEASLIHLHLRTSIKGVGVKGPCLHPQDVGQLDQAQAVLRLHITRL